MIHTLRKRWLDYQTARFYAENRRILLKLEAENIASDIERHGYVMYARECRRGWAKASAGRRDYWRNLAKRGF